MRPRVIVYSTRLHRLMTKTLRIDKLAAWKLQYRCAALSICQFAPCRLIQTRQPATHIIVIDITSTLDRSDAIDNLSGVIEFKRYLGQAVEIAVRMRAHHERNLWFGEPDFDCLGHQTCSRISVSC